MMEDLKKQAERFVTFAEGLPQLSIFLQKPYRITIDGEKIREADALIISTGASAKYLGLPDEVNMQVWECRPALLAMDFSTEKK